MNTDDILLFTKTIFTFTSMVYILNVLFTYINYEHRFPPVERCKNQPHKLWDYTKIYNSNIFTDSTSNINN